jgi:hypothetical protein
MRSARLLLTFILAAQAISGFLLDWTRHHLLNPLWHPHARFHGGLLVPGSTPWAGDPAHVPHLAGHVFYPNQAVAAAVLLLTGLGWRLSRV